MPLARALLAAGASLEARDRLGAMALARAARAGHVALVELFLARGAAIDARNLFGAYPSLSDALQSVRALVKQHGSGATEGMMLLFDDGEDFIDLAEGATLAKFALAGRVPGEIVRALSVVLRWRRRARCPACPAR